MSKVKSKIFGFNENILTFGVFLKLFPTMAGQMSENPHKLIKK
jgi:hypothetical protein